MSRPAAVDDWLDDESLEPMPHHDLNAPLTVVLPPGFYRTSRLANRRTLGVLGGVGALALVGLVAFMAKGSQATTHRAPREAQLAAPAAVAAPARSRDAARAAEPSQPADPAALALFDQRAAGLGLALGAFRARLADPVASGDCAALAASRAVVSHGFDSLSTAMRGAGPSLDVGRSMRFNKLTADASVLDREFHRTRCARTTPPAP